MKITTPQITWHGGENGKNDPVLTADVHPCGALVTGGADADIRVWRLHLDENEESKFQDYLYSLPGHEGGVNVVRFSPDGRTLATAGDRGHIYLYCLPPGRPLSFWLRQSTSSKIIARLCHTTQTDIYDLSWSPDSKEMVTVSVDNKVSFWTMHNGKAVPKESFTSHSNYVQGVAWDPRNKYIVSESNDRSCRVYIRQEGKATKKNKRPGPATIKEHKVIKLLNPPKEDQATTATTGASSTTGGAAAAAGTPFSAPTTPAPSALSHPSSSSAASSSSSAAEEKEQEEKDSETETKMNDEDDDDIEIIGVKEGPTPVPVPPPTPVLPTTKRAPRAHLFADETVPSFFRRLAWSPDGCLLVTPTGLYRDDPEGQPEYTTHVYIREKFDRPTLVLPHTGKASIVVRFCPQLFELKKRARYEEEDGATATEEGKEPSSVSAPSLTNLPYRMVFAVLTVNGILVYDTQHHYPLAFIKNSHYAPLTDAAWLSDGSGLIATSMDGYLTVVCFADNELGEPLELSKVPPTVRALHVAHYDKVLKEAEDDEDEKADAKESEKSEAEQRAKEKAKAAEREKMVLVIDDEDDGSEEEGDKEQEVTKKSKASPEEAGEEDEEGEEEEGKKVELRKSKRLGGVESDGESLKSGDDMSEDEEEEEEEEGEEEEEEEGGSESEEGDDEDDEAELEDVKGKEIEEEEQEEETIRSPPKKRPSSEDGEPEDALKSTIDASAAGVAAAGISSSTTSSKTGGEKKRAKRIAPTLLVGPSGSSAPSSAAAPSSSLSPSLPQSKTSPSQQPQHQEEGVAEGGAVGEKESKKQKKRVTPMLVAPRAAGSSSNCGSA